MYEVLVKRLRECTAEQNGEKTLWHQAADAIEELSAHYCPHAIRNVHDRGDDSLCRVLMREVPKWIPVKERLPEEQINPNTQDFEYVLCATIWGDVRPFKYGTPIGHKDAHFWNGAGYVDAYVTHWMPLPEVPKGE